MSAATTAAVTLRNSMSSTNATDDAIAATTDVSACVRCDQQDSEPSACTSCTLSGELCFFHSVARAIGFSAELRPSEERGSPEHSLPPGRQHLDLRQRDISDEEIISRRAKREAMRKKQRLSRRMQVTAHATAGSDADDDDEEVEDTKLVDSVEIPGALPPGWTSAVDYSGITYYINSATLETQWDKPAKWASSPSPPAGGSPLQATDTFDCPICLTEEVPARNAKELGCGHKFCQTCLAQMVAHGTQDSLNQLPCPCCKQPFQARGRGVQIAGREYARTCARRAVHLRGSRSLTPEELRELQRAAGRIEVRFCPGCNAPIQKNGGCPSMTCACCEKRFHWQRARPLRPCRRCHSDPDEGFVGRWITCAHCSTTAKVQAAALRAVTVAALAPAALAGVGAIAAYVSVGLVVAAVPAVTVGPLALAYEPVRRLRRPKSKNRLAIAAASGACAMVLPVIMCCADYDSD